MKFYITCSRCHKEVKHDFGSGKKAEERFEYWNESGSWVCSDCYNADKEAAYQAKKAADYAAKLEAGWTEINVHYGVYKKEYAGFCNNKGELVQKGEYHSNNKTIDLLVPAGKLLKLNDSEIDILKRPTYLPFFETEEEFEAQKAALLARFEENEDEASADIEEEQEAEKKPEWKRIEINECFAGKRHGNSVLIHVPSSSDYAGYSFWHPVKCFKQNNAGMTYLSYTTDWNFKLKANGGVLEKNLTAEEFEAGISTSDWCHFECPGEYHEPLKLEAVEAEAIEELVDND